MVATAIHWYQKLQVRSKILLGVGSIVFLGMLLIISFFIAQSILRNALNRVATEEQPSSAAAYEMEISVGNSDLNVINYLRTGKLKYRNSAIKNKGDFDYYLSQYSNMANSEAEEDFGLLAGSL